MILPILPGRETEEKLENAWELDSALNSFARLWKVFMNARVACAGVLVILQAALQALGTSTHHWAMAVSVGYLGATLAVRLWAHPRPPSRTFDAQWIAVIGVDVIAFSLLSFLQPSGINYTLLFALPVLLASVLGPILLAFGTAASVTLLLLGDAWWSSLQGAGDFNARFLQAGLSGSGFFLVALLANQLALRLAREEQLLQKSQSSARMQTEVNELVIATLVDGVLVMDVNGMVRSANPAARHLLNAQDSFYAAPFMLTAQPAWQPLMQLMHQTFAMQCAQEANLSLIHPGLNARRLQVRSRLTAAYDGTQECLCVIFLKDLRELEARVRIEKLAAMGRMSAAVAHEIRNPLTAISQANALLEEDLIDTGQRQLTGLIGQNTRRLAKIVDEVLDISRVQEQIPVQQTTTLRLDDAARQTATDWAKQNVVFDRVHISTATGNAAVCFDVEHLRRLMINLLDNALRYTSGPVRSIEVITTLVAAGQARLAVWSSGQPLEETVQRHLFEPFFSSESRSSGLGLYICRELCERYDALIGYQRVTHAGTEGNEFFVMFRPASQFLSAELSYLDSVIV